MSTWPNRGASGGPCGGLVDRRTEQPKTSDHTSLTQANRPPRKPVRFRPAVGAPVERQVRPHLVRQVTGVSLVRSVASARAGSNGRTSSVRPKARQGFSAARLAASSRLVATMNQ